MTSTHRTPRGSTLLVAVILLAVLSVVAVAAVRLSSEERRNASAKARYDALEACARAAQAQVWAEIAKYGPTYLKGGNLVPAPAALPGGVTVRAPAHYSDMTADTGSVQVQQVVLGFDKGVSDGKVVDSTDLTNRAAALDALNDGKAYRVVARCKDQKDRELEIEFSMRFTLF